jgi:predicted nucleotidyltransferase
MNDINTIAQKYVQNIKNSGVPVIGAYLFGSYAKGNFHKDSDIDICIVSNNFGNDYIKESVDLRKLAFGIDIRIEPIPFTPEDLNDKYSTLASEIKKHGILIN